MKRPWSIVEDCAGSAALTCHLLGAKQSLVPYQGGKWKFRKPLAALVAELGFKGAPSSVRLDDIGPWGRVWPLLFHPAAAALVVAELGAMHAQDGHALYASLHGAPTPTDIVRYAAEFLWLQRTAYRGFAVAGCSGTWSSRGLNKTALDGLPASATFAAVKPLVPHLIKGLHFFTQQRAAWGATEGPLLRYIDPPYVDTTGYPDGDLGRDAVVERALAAQARGEAVIVSEGVPVEELLACPGWASRRLPDRDGRVLTSGRSHKSTSEFVTFCSGA